MEFDIKIRDLALAIKRTHYLRGNNYKEKKTKFIQQYKKFNSLTKKEENQIVPIIIKDNCIMFWWYYKGVQKRQNIRYPSIQYLAKETKKLAKEIGWLN